jgi:hypothetical protein
MGRLREWMGEYFWGNMARNRSGVPPFVYVSSHDHGLTTEVSVNCSFPVCPDIADVLGTHLSLQNISYFCKLNGTREIHHLKGNHCLQNVKPM